MTVGKVVDASALAAVVFGEPESEAMAARLRGAALHAPPILPFEMANVAWKKARRQPEFAGVYRAAIAEFLLLPIRMIHVDIEAALDLALEAQVTAYDAAYVVAARLLNVELVTLDKKLAEAAKRM